jgi:antitoxin ParD1/3/4
MPTKNLVITEQQSEWLEGLVKSGRYQNASEVMRRALQTLQLQEQIDAERHQALLAAIQLGRDDIAAGRYVTLSSGDEIREFFDAAVARVLHDKTAA